MRTKDVNAGATFAPVVEEVVDGPYLLPKDLGLIRLMDLVAV